MDFERVFELLKNDHDFNFLAFAITPWQSNGIDAYIRCLKDQNIDVRGYVILIPHGVTGRAVFRENFITDDDNIRFIEIEQTAHTVLRSYRELLKEKFGEDLYACLNRIYIAVRRPYTLLQKINSVLKQLKLSKVSPKNKRVVRVVCPGGIRYSWLETLYKLKQAIYVKFVLLDDGSGTLCGYGRISFRRRIKDSIMRKALTENNRIEKFVLIDGDKGNVSIDKNTAGYYSKVFQVKGNLPEFQKLITPYEGRAVMSTQCLISNKLISYDEDLLIFDEFIKILEEHKVDTIIKPHPREIDISRYDRYKTYGVLVDSASRNRITMECILANLKQKPPFVFGIFSSSLANAKIFFDVPAISFVRLFSERVSMQDTKQRVKDYAEYYESIVDIPGSWEEAEELVRKYIRTYKR